MSNLSAPDRYDYVIYIGRFQIFHNGHLATLQKALKYGRKVIIVMGSSNLPRTVKNPFTAAERHHMIDLVLADDDRKRVLFTHTNDYMYNDQRWVQEVQTRISALILEKNARVAIVGMKKDESTYYLELFPQWDFIAQESVGDLHATRMREAYFEGSINLYPYGDNLPRPVLSWLFKDFFVSKEYQKLRQEYDFLKAYKKLWANTPYPVIFTTVDAVVIKSGHVLMVKRKANPGEGLLALPGGFVGVEESLLSAMLRELKEETKIKLPVPVLEGHIKDFHVFDHPKRSERGRTITYAYLIDLKSGTLDKVKGGDDASKALWVPLEDIEKKRDIIYEDHADIITFFLGRV